MPKLSQITFQNTFTQNIYNHKSLICAIYTCLYLSLTQFIYPMPGGAVEVMCGIDVVSFGEISDSNMVSGVYTV